MELLGVGESEPRVWIERVHLIVYGSHCTKRSLVLPKYRQCLAWSIPSIGPRCGAVMLFLAAATERFRTFFLCYLTFPFCPFCTLLPPIYSWFRLERAFGKVIRMSRGRCRLLLSGEFPVFDALGGCRRSEKRVVETRECPPPPQTWPWDRPRRPLSIILAFVILKKRKRRRRAECRVSSSSSLSLSRVVVQPARSPTIRVSTRFSHFISKVRTV